MVENTEPDLIAQKTDGIVLFLSIIMSDKLIALLDLVVLQAERPL